MSVKNMSIIFSSGINSLVEQNSSFDKGILRVAYVGDNRNGSSISKDVFEKCIHTIYNCPVVCRYDRDTDTLGSHDVELVHRDDGLHMVNVTHPVGVIPSEAKYYWEEVDEPDGAVHEYLCVEVLLWKRQEAYQKIRSDGIVDESMEITVKQGELVDGVFVIKDFEFTAFCLLGTAQPCYESASLEVFSDNGFKSQFAEMMQELKESISQVNHSITEVNIHPHTNTKNYLEGGNEVLEEKLALVAEFGFSVDTLDFCLDDFTVDELREKFEAIKSESEAEKFALAKQVLDELNTALSMEQVDTEWGSMCRYFYCDHDAEALEVYCYDTQDNWNLYGFSYSMDGDSAVIDFDSRKRKKFSIVDFDMGEQSSPTISLFELMGKQITEVSSEWSAKYQISTETIDALRSEIDELRNFKVNVESAQHKAECDAVFAQFEDLTGIAAFEELRQSCDNGTSDISISELEDKCFSIRGRQGFVAKFSADPAVSAPKLKVTHENTDVEPYGGVFKKYGY